MKFIEETLKENPKIKYIGLFGSRSRGNNFLNSDVDLVLLGTLSEDIKEIEDKAVLEFNAPKADIYLLKRESIEHPTVNPKTVTMGLDLIELYRDKDENEVSLNIGELDSKWFCSFLEYERLRTLEIFYDKEATPDYIKKMPGGRRSYDEIIWLSKLANWNIDLPLELKDHLSRIKFGVLNRDWKEEISRQKISLDRIIFDLECSLVDGLYKSMSRGDSALDYLSNELARTLRSTNPKELEKIYSKNIDLKNQNSWLIQYVLAFNSLIPEEIAEEIASAQRANLFDYEIKKSLLQNRAIKNRRISKTVEILSEDKNPIVKTYANLIRDPNYVQNFQINQRRFLRDNVNHIL